MVGVNVLVNDHLVSLGVKEDLRGNHADLAPSGQCAMLVDLDDHRARVLLLDGRPVLGVFQDDVLVNGLFHLDRHDEEDALDVIAVGRLCHGKGREKKGVDFLWK